MSARVPMRGTGAEQAVVALKDRNGSGAKGLPHCADGAAATTGDNAGGRTVVKSAKPFPVSKRQVWEAYKRVKPTAVRQVLTDRHWLGLARMLQTISTNCGTDWLPAVICRRR